MNILAFDLPFCNHHNLVSLVKSGHTVYRCSYGDHSYIESLGVKSPPELAYHDFIDSPDKPRLVRDVIEQYDIDLIINTDPQEAWMWIEFASEMPYIGPCNYVSNLEVHRLVGKEFAQKAGVKVPEIMGRYHSRDFDSSDWSKPLVIKPVKRYCSTMVCQPGQEADLKKALDAEYPHEIYVEEYLADTREITTNYTVIDGEYIIYVSNYDANCQYNYGPDRRQTRDWHTDVYSVGLDTESELINYKNVEKIVHKLSEFPGNHEGHLTGYMTQDGEWYFGELGVRRYTHSPIPTLFTGDQWLECMLGDMSTYRDAWSDKTIIQTIIQTPHPEDRYPIELHDTYPEIYQPSGLKDDFSTATGAVMISTQTQHRSVMDAFIYDLETSTRFTANRPY